MRLIWDRGKATSNFRKHQVSFEESDTIRIISARVATRVERALYEEGQD